MVRYDKSVAKRGGRYVRSGGSGIPGGGKTIGGAGGVVMLLLALFLGPEVLEGANTTQTGSPQPAVADGECPPGETQELLCFLMEDLNTTWDEIFNEYGDRYEPTLLTIFEGSVNTNGCGGATSAVGPFYCPAPQDKGVYIDLDFYDELATKFEAPGDFAQAYVIAHEVGHHISNIRGDSEEIRRNQASDPNNSNQYQVLLELQADCYAGIWAESASKRKTSQGLSIIEKDDIAEGLKAAAEVGDDRIQKRVTGQIQPHKWTHGSANQRQAAFVTGLQSGERESCSLEKMIDVTREY